MQNYLNFKIIIECQKTFQKINFGNKICLVYLPYNEKQNKANQTSSEKQQSGHKESAYTF